MHVNVGAVRRIVFSLSLTYNRYNVIVLKEDFSMTTSTYNAIEKYHQLPIAAVENLIRLTLFKPNSLTSQQKLTRIKKVTL